MRLPDHRAIAAAIVLVIAMGFGRFAFTGLYPVMLVDGALSLSGGSYAAAANYAGYLLGAVLLGAVPSFPSRIVSVASMLAGVALLGALTLPLDQWAIIVVRALAGVASALSLVAASQWLMHDQRQPSAAPILFAGVGVGIVLSAELTVLAQWSGLDNRGAWAVLAAAALLAALLSGVLMLRSPAHPPLAQANEAPGDNSRPLPALLLVSIYGLAGFGYIVTATYLPVLVQTTLAGVDPLHVWAAFGLGAVPSCFFWHWLTIRVGTRRSLMLNLLLQAGGVALPALALSPLTFLVSALLVGGTFMGTVTIAMPAARRLAGSVRFNILGIMTASYGVGQIAGPVLSNVIIGATGTFAPALALAAASLALGAAATL
jgi:MFS family permease